VSSQFDSIVIGGGHNGLVCAAYLARAGKRVLVLDDVATTGNAILQAVAAARAAEAVADSALVLVDREEGASEALARDGIRLLSVFRARDFL